jgi:hypothetical protein
MGATSNNAIPSITHIKALSIKCGGCHLSFSPLPPTLTTKQETLKKPEETTTNNKRLCSAATNRLEHP